MPKKPSNPSSIVENISRLSRKKKTDICSSCQEEKLGVKFRECICGFCGKLCLKCFNEHKESCDYAICNFCTFEFLREDVIKKCPFCNLPCHDYCLDEHIAEAHPASLI